MTHPVTKAWIGETYCTTYPLELMVVVIVVVGLLVVGVAGNLIVDGVVGILIVVVLKGLAWMFWLKNESCQLQKKMHQ